MRRMGGRKTLRALLAGGDRRSLASSARALALVEADTTLVPELVALADDPEWLVGLRALDLLEKLAQARPRLVAPHRRLFLGPLADSDKWEIRLQVVRALPLFDWKGAERRRALEILGRDARHPRRFVRAWAVDSLATFAQRDRSLVPLVNRLLRELDADGGALAARARRTRARLQAD